MSDPKDVTEVGAESGLGISSNEEPQVVQDENASLSTDEQLETEEMQPVESLEGAVDMPDSVEAEQEGAAEEAAESAEPAEETVEPAAESASAAVPAESKSIPKPAASIGDLIAVGIISLLMGALMVYIMSVAMPSGGASESSDGSSDLSGGVAVTVNGTAVGENEISKYIEQFRKVQGVEDDAAWGSWLVANGLTPETLRSAIIDQFTAQELIKQAANEQGITVSDEDIDALVKQAVEENGGEEAFAKLLGERGMSMQDVRKDAKLNLTAKKLAETVAGDIEVTDEEILEMLKMYGQVDEDAKSLDGVEEDMLQYFRDQMKTDKMTQAYQQWMTDYQAKAEIKVEDMPEGLPYAIDIAPYEEAAKAEAAAAAQDGAMSDDAEAGGAEEIEVEADDAEASVASASADSEAK